MMKAHKAKLPGRPHKTVAWIWLEAGAPTFDQDLMTWLWSRK
jgi:hypothetical protein